MVERTLRWPGHVELMKVFRETGYFSLEPILVGGQLVRPRDLTAAVFKAGDSPEALDRRVIVGIPGTPMPANSWAYGDDAWYLVYYVRSLGPERNRAADSSGCSDAAPSTD